eukprot:609096-Karenia_brevis.AAC.1
MEFAKHPLFAPRMPNCNDTELLVVIWDGHLSLRGLHVLGTHEHIQTLNPTVQFGKTIYN